MIETVKINWMLLLALFLWAVGVALVVVLVGLMEYRETSAGLSRREFWKQRLVMRTLLIITVLGVSGLVFMFLKLPSGNLIAVKVKKLAQERLVKIEAGVGFLPGNLHMDSHNKSHILNNEKMKDNTMVMFWDGYMRTPFFCFPAGDFTFEFTARGSYAGEEFAKLKIELEVPDKNNYLVVHTVKYIELNDQFMRYSMNFQIDPGAVEGCGMVGRVRVTYFNDLYLPEVKAGRDVWIKEVSIKKR